MLHYTSWLQTIQPIGRSHYECHGKLHTYKWYFKRELHRLDGPAIEVFDKDGVIELRRYYCHGIPHRIDGPAFEDFHQNGNIRARTWYMHGKLHRLDGPAQESFHENGRCDAALYYLNDDHLSLDDHRRRVALLKLSIKNASDCEVSL